MANTKALKVFMRDNQPHFVVGWEGGGEVPMALIGYYTSEGAAQTAIFNYVKAKEKPAKKSEAK